MGVPLGNSNFAVNVGLSFAGKKYTGNFYILDNKKMLVESNKYIDSLRIKTPDILSHVETLSGGNQQKVVVAKWLEADYSFFIFDEPYKGIDIGAK